MAYASSGYAETGTGANVRLPIVLRSAADIEALKNHPRGVRKLPPNGVRLDIDGLNADAALRFTHETGIYVRACGCAFGGACALAALSLVLAATALRVVQQGPRWQDLAMAAAGIVLAFLCAGLGKFVGMALAKWRFQRCCDDVLHAIDRVDENLGERS